MQLTSSGMLLGMLGPVEEGATAAPLLLIISIILTMTLLGVRAPLKGSEEDIFRRDFPGANSRQNPFRNPRFHPRSPSVTLIYASM